MKHQRQHGRCLSLLCRAHFPGKKYISNLKNHMRSIVKRSKIQYDLPNDSSLGFKVGFQKERITWGCIIGVCRYISNALYFAVISMVPGNFTYQDYWCRKVLPRGPWTPPASGKRHQAVQRLCCASATSTAWMPVRPVEMLLLAHCSPRSLTLVKSLSTPDSCPPKSQQT